MAGEYGGVDRPGPVSRIESFCSSAASSNSYVRGPIIGAASPVA
jgi:hypothetical protein